jgi:uncharacterized repeat protein (TIGR01451 family)
MSLAFGKERWVTKKRLLVSLFVTCVLGSIGMVPPGARTVSENSTVPKALSMHTTIEAIGVVAPYTGDDNQNNVASIWYRRAGTSAWMAGPEMVADRFAREWRVSLVHLSPGTEYQVEVRFTDADGVDPAAVNGSIRTRPDYPNVGSGGNISYVATAEDLEAAIKTASPGDTIRIHAGTYYTSASLGVADSGEPGRYLTIEAAPGELVILDGSDPDLNDPAVDNWHPYQGNIYYADLAWGDSECDNFSLPRYVGEQRDGDGVRYLLYRGSGQWNAFLDALPGKAYYDCHGRLYVATYDGVDPDDREMHVSRRGIGFSLAGADYVRIRSLEFRYYGLSGVYLAAPGADHNIIEGNTFHGIGRFHIHIGDGGTDNLIQDNRFYEIGYRDSGWTWDEQYHYALMAVIRLYYAGPGNVIRRNTLKNGTDAISVGWQSHNTDVYENLIEDYMDDGIEVDDQPGYNIRVWANILRHCYSSISTQDWFIGDYWNAGPVYIYRNIIEGGSDPQGRTAVNGDIEGYFSNFAFKVGTDLDRVGRVYYYHNTVYIPDSPVGGNGIQDAAGGHFSGIVARNNLWDVRGRVFRLHRPTTVTHHDMDCDNLHNAGTPTDARFIQWSNTGGPEGDGVYRNLADFQAYTGQELHGISDNGTLFNPDLSLQAGSPEIDAGCLIVGFNDRGPWAYKGQMPDIGAFEFSDEPDLSASTKTASTAAVSTGDSLIYTVRIVNTGKPLTTTVTMTDALPVGLDYLTGTLTTTLGTVWVTPGPNTSIGWQGNISDTPTAEIRFGVSVTISDTLALQNIAAIDDGLDQVITRSATIIVNGLPVYLPIVLRN